MPVRVVLDTNFLLVPAQFGIDIFEESARVVERAVEIVVLESVVMEIESKLQRQQSRTERTAFRIAKNLIERCRVIPTSPRTEGMGVDDQLLEYAVREHCILATNDRELRRRARERGVPVIHMRGRKRLEIEGHVL